MNVDKPLNYRTISNQAIGEDSVAKELHEQGLKLFSECRHQEAEQCFQQALIEDVSFGPAHNSLGKLYFEQKKFYLAAWEFEYAIRTMPKRPEPYNNLGLVLESVGQFPLATDNYAKALEAEDDNAEYLGNYLRCRYRENGFTEDLRQKFEELILVDQRPDWVHWARGILSKNHPEIRSLSNTNPHLDRPIFESNELLPIQPKDLGAPASSTMLDVDLNSPLGVFGDD